MGETVRFGVSLAEELLEEFDELIYERGYSNRSEALRDLIRNELVQEEWKADEECAGVVSLVYDHHTGDLMGRLTDVQHKFEEEIICNTHIHLDHHNCLEVIVLFGTASRLQKVADQLT
ncbi:MAG: nickel-responsive transcriptional regulator NikR, partial [bacterium]